MLISYNWLKKHVTLPGSIPPEEVAAKLKASTVEVEALVRPGDGLEGIVVGKIKTVEKHPNADKLKVCRVALGNEEVVIVCGGSNVAEGMLVAVAKLGARVRWHGEGEPIIMEKATIRGVDSFGMICASDEVGLGEQFPKKEEREIVDLTHLGLKPGVPLAVALELNDTIFEIDNKSLSHRPDLWGHYGLAREVAVLYGREVNKVSGKKIKPGKGMNIKVVIENKNDCLRYSAVGIDGIRPGESPAWLKNALKAIGLKPINSIVDATNYVMADVGQPLHAFDASRLASGKTPGAKVITVRRARAGESLVTLDGVERILDESALVIADDNQPLALAGVMGGLTSGISAETSTVIIESATFNAGLIRAASGMFGLRSDASMRFEKSLDPNLTMVALEKVVALLLDMHPGAKVASGIVDEYLAVRKPQPLEMPVDFFTNKIGIQFPDKYIEQTLARLGFEVQLKKKTFSLKIPTWRCGKDVVLPEDVVEEIVRFFGYDAIPSVLPCFPITPPPLNPLKTLERTAADLLSNQQGYTEVYNYSFVSKEQVKRLGDEPESYLELDNPVSKEKPFLRRNLLPNLLEALEKGSAAADRLALFEIGLVFHADEAGVRNMEQSDELLPRQDTWLTSVYLAKKDRAPFWEARRVAEVFFRRFGQSCTVTPVAAASLRSWQHPGRVAWLMVEGVAIGEVYELHPAVSERYGLKDRVGVCSFNLSLLSAQPAFGGNARQYVPIPLYPEVVRDIAFVVPVTASHGAITAALHGVDPLIKKVEIFDVFSGATLKPGSKSMAYHVTYARLDGTLTSGEVDAVETKVVGMLQKKFEADIRK